MICRGYGCRWKFRLVEDVCGGDLRLKDICKFTLGKALREDDRRKERKSAVMFALFG